MSGNNGDERWYISCDGGDISVDDLIHRFRSQDTSHSSSRNCGITVDGDCIGWYRSDK